MTSPASAPPPVPAWAAESFAAPSAAAATPLPYGALEACFASAAVGLLIVSPEGRVLRANSAFGAIVGTTAEALIGRTALEFTHPDDRAETQRLLEELVTARQPQIEWEKRYLRADGATVWAQVSATAVYGSDGAPVYQVLTVHDRTAARALLQQLEAASLRYGRFFEANLFGVAVATERGVEEANDEMLRVAGTTRAAFEAHRIDWQAITPPEHLPRDYAGLQAIRDRGTCAPFEKDYVWPDGTRVPLLVGGALLDEEPLRWIAFAFDLTERKRAERERDRLLGEAQLARGVAERALIARDALLARITHDLRTPLAANRGYASMMRDGIPVPLPPEYQETVRRMLANQDHLLALIDELLQFARASATRADVTLEPLDVDTLLQSIEPVVRPLALAAGLTYTCAACTTPLAIRGDRLKVTEILVNLVGNAIKFTPAGGEITVAAVGADGVVHLTVTDTGAGIAPEDRERIFEPFVHAVGNAVGTPRALRSASVGRSYGLGLAISRELARTMGGDLSVESTPGHGTAFTLALPRA